MNHRSVDPRRRTVLKALAAGIATPYSRVILVGIDLALAGCNASSGSTSANPAPTGSASSLSYAVVDTGQTICYGNTSPLSAAPASPGDPFYGQDAQFTGLQPAYQDNGDGTVTDLETGLMWVQARGSKLSWADAVAGASTCNVGGYGDWRMPTVKELYSLIKFTGDLGATDAASIPYIDTNYFAILFGDTNPNESTSVVGNRVIDGQDWTATKYVSTTMDGSETVFGVNFIDGRIKGYPVYVPATSSPNDKYVRYVRGTTVYGNNRYVDNGDGTVTDNATGLMWAQSDSGTGMNWEDALAWVQLQNAANYAGYSDWRMPNAKELQSIVDYDRSPDTTGTAAIDPVLQCTSIINEGGVTDFPWYWSGTTHVEYNTSNEAVYVAFGRALGWMELNGASCYSLYDVHGAGAQRTDPKSGALTDYLLGTNCDGTPMYGRGPQGDVVRINNYVRLVRGGQ